MTELTIRDATPQDAPAIAEIYNHYILETAATFEVEAISNDDARARINKIKREGYPWIVAEQDGLLVGYAYLSEFRDRAAYAQTLESTVYLTRGAGRRGVGTALYTALIERARAIHTHVLVGVVSLPNPGSVALHERMGFVHAGTLAEVGYKHGRWIDVGYWHLGLY